MSLLPLKLPPGVSRPGTKYDARGRWYDANLVRWHEGAMRPVGGWRELQLIGGADLDLGEPARGILAWRTNTQAPNIAFGTTSKAWQYANGVATDITPVGFTAGQTDASLDFGNFGQGPYGVGDYGVGAAITGLITEAQSWAFDAFGEFLVACAYSDGKLYYWDPNGADPLVEMTGAPVDCTGVVVTPERFIVALGAGGDARMLQWPDQESLTDWTPGSTNQAGSFPLTGSGQIMAGRRGRKETLIWTDVDLYVMRYIGGTLVYSVQQVGSGCGLAARNGVGMVGGHAFWMGRNAFHEYNGTWRPIPCEVHDHVFGDINRTQISKVACEVRSSFNEITWFYPSSASDENDRYVTFNYATRHWQIGRLARTAAIDSGVISLPAAVAPNGKVYEHEAEGATYPHHVTGEELVPYAESGPVEIANGDRVMFIRKIIPDENTLGSVTATLYASLFPTSTERSQAVTLANPTPTRLTGRQVRLRVEHAAADWRVGTPRLEVIAGGAR